MKILPLFLLVFFSSAVRAQSVTAQLQAAMSRMEKEEPFKHASIALYVVNSKNGQPVFDKNPQLGLAPASTQKVVTSASAYELLGKDFAYTSVLGYEGSITNGELNGRLVFTGSGDPTLGSWRWKQTNENSFKEQLLGALRTKNISKVNGGLFINDSIFDTQATPNGWTWDDIGNYYGAGVWGVNWRENQYDLYLKPGAAVGDPVQLLSTDPDLDKIYFINELTTGKAGSGDNSIIYLPENGSLGVIRGTVPAGVNKFKVKGSIPDAPAQMALTIKRMLTDNGVAVNGQSLTALQNRLAGNKAPAGITPIVDFVSPPLDSINNWFMKESINLYGEALVKTIALKKNPVGSTSDGLDVIQEFWKTKGIGPGELKMRDGSGLSPANRITANALVTILQYARTQPWFASFYNSLPLQNNTRMKSGYIGGVRSYAGYVRSKTGEEYSFAFIINNFDGSPSAVRDKMWKLLDILK